MVILPFCFVFETERWTVGYNVKKVVAGAPPATVERAGTTTASQSGGWFVIEKRKNEN